MKERDLTNCKMSVIIAEMDDITENSTVVEVGGYLGIFTSEMITQKNPNLHIIEPITAFYNELVNKFGNNKKVSIHKTCISDKAEDKTFWINGYSTSENKTWAASEQSETIKSIRFEDFCKQNNITEIDLLAINCEGCEYTIVPEILKQTTVKIKSLMIQFHNISPDCECAAKQIIEAAKDKYEIEWDRGIWKWIKLKEK